MIDPRDDSDPALPVAVVLALSLELQPLVELAGWPPVGERLEAIPGVLRGTHSLTRADIRCLRRWAARWADVSPRLRAFYAAETAPDALGGPAAASVIDAALWRILEGEERPDLSGRQRAALGVRWVARYGAPPSMDLAPKPDSRTR